MNNKLHKLLDDIEVLSQEMLSACEAKDWNQLAVLEHERSRAITDVFNDMPDHVGSSQGKLIYTINFVLGLNEKINKICTREALDCQMQLAELNQGHKVIAAYNRCRP